mgnify:CR=1 FL=1
MELCGVVGGRGRERGEGGDFYFNDTATTEIYTLSLHDALPICNDKRDNELSHQANVLHAELERIWPDPSSPQKIL